MFEAEPSSLGSSSSGSAREMPPVFAGRAGLLGALELRFRACRCLGVDPSRVEATAWPTQTTSDGLLTARPVARPSKTRPVCRMFLMQAYEVVVARHRKT